MTDQTEDTTPNEGDGQYVRLEPFERNLECEHTENPDPPTGNLVGCELEAEYTLSSPLWSDETRTRYCSIHIWDAIERHVEKLKPDHE